MFNSQDALKSERDFNASIIYQCFIGIRLLLIPATDGGAVHQCGSKIGTDASQFTISAYLIIVN